MFCLLGLLGMQRDYAEDGVEADEMMMNATPSTRRKKQQQPPRPPRKGSLSQNEDMSQMNGNLEPGLLFNYNPCLNFYKTSSVMVADSR